MTELYRDSFHYYDYAGGTYYVVKLCWFYNAPENLEALVWTNGREIKWHLHGSVGANGIFYENTGYHAEITPTKELLDYFQYQRHWQNEYVKCSNKEERMKVMNKFKQIGKD